MNKKSHMFKRPTKDENPIKVIPHFLDENVSNREGTQKPTYIVIHEVSLGTGRSPKNYNMEHYKNVINEAAKRR